MAEAATPKKGLARFIDFPATSPAALFGFAVLVIAVMVVVHRTGLGKRIGV